MENQEEKEEQREQSPGDCQQQKKNDGNSVLPGRAQPNTASYHSCQSGQNDQPRQNVERPYPAAGSQRKKEIERHRCNNSVDGPEEPKPNFHDSTLITPISLSLAFAACRLHGPLKPVD
jgi:hypothetical protein